MTFELFQLPLYLTILVAAFSGSWHCGMMCGPVAVAIHRQGGLGLYHLGRGLSYMTLGALLGALGNQVLNFQSFKLQVFVALLMSGVILYQFVGDSMKVPGCVATPFFRWIRHPFWVGLLTPLIPCGWLWIYFSAAASTGSAFGGALVLGLLWLGGIPALSVLAIYFRQGFKGATIRQKKWLGAGIAVAALWALWGRLLLTTIL